MAGRGGILVEGVDTTAHVEQIAQWHIGKGAAARVREVALHRIGGIARHAAIEGRAIDRLRPRAVRERLSPEPPAPLGTPEETAMRRDEKTRGEWLPYQTMRTRLLADDGRTGEAARVYEAALALDLAPGGAAGGVPSGGWPPSSAGGSGRWGCRTS